VVAPNEKLAESLRLLKQQQDAGHRVFRSRQFTRTHRERLVKAGFLLEVVKGWYMLSRPGEPEGSSTSWYASFFEFVAAYCDTRFGENWYLSPEASLAYHAEDTVVPRQVLVHTSLGSNNNLKLKFDTALFDYKTSEMVEPEDIIVVDNLRLLSLPAALIRASPTLFTKRDINLHVALVQVRDVSDVLAKLLAGGQSSVAGRLAGAFRAIGRPEHADRITRSMTAAGYRVLEHNPFERPMAALGSTATDSACSRRIRCLWASMRDVVLAVFPVAPGIPADTEAYLADLTDRYVEDAYHSLSIEGYQVSEGLIAKIAAGAWKPEASNEDRQDRNALAAKGYFQAFKQVRESVIQILKRDNPGRVVWQQHHDWYMQLFEPSVLAGILEAKHLAGYRANMVYIRNARHAPPRYEAVRAAMPTLFDLLTEETEPAVRAVLGHFVFVYLHPYMDGNGRMGRFLMNAMLASGGYPWTVVKVSDRNQYMRALDQASSDGNIEPFAKFIATCVELQQAASAAANKHQND
jgi:hypothetical protein